jgi:hypothetical protein
MLLLLVNVAVQMLQHESCVHAVHAGVCVQCTSVSLRQLRFFELLAADDEQHRA